MKIKIVSGGQTGVDQGGLEAAVELGLEFGGWAPFEWMMENIECKTRGAQIPECYRGKMREHPDCGSRAENYRARTKANIRDSHATLILADAYPLSGGTLLTRNTCEALMKPHFTVTFGEADAIAKTRKWLRQLLSEDFCLVLNVAGPRESKAPGIQTRTRAFLEELLRGTVDGA